MAALSSAEDEMRALQAYNKSEDPESTVAPVDVLKRIAATGTLRHDWRLIQKLVLKSVEKVLKAYREAAARGTTLGSDSDRVALEEAHQELCGKLAARTGAPFTLQRICEVITNPRQYYTNVFKLTRALEKLINVSMSLSPAPPLYLPPPTPVAHHHVEDSPHVKRSRIERSVDEIAAAEHWPEGNSPSP